VGASAELEAVADQVVLQVKSMNGANRIRFANQPELLAAWMSASHVFAEPKGGRAERRTGGAFPLARLGASSERSEGGGHVGGPVRDGRPAA
jgi:hypothetical protein